jgi:anaerobic selenocysteine-containing dehydrogenase
MKPKRSGGGLAALRYSLARGREAGGVAALTKRLATRNTCKTCAVGMGGQQGGMRNEAGTFPEVCKKSVQAQAADMQPPIGDDFLRAHDLASLERWTSRELEYAGRLGFPMLWREGATHFARIGWDEALAIAAGAHRAAPPDRTFF